MAGFCRERLTGELSEFVNKPGTDLLIANDLKNPITTLVIDTELRCKKFLEAFRESVWYSKFKDKLSIPSLVKDGQTIQFSIAENYQSPIHIDILIVLSPCSCYLILTDNMIIVI